MMVRIVSIPVRVAFALRRERKPCQYPKSRFSTAWSLSINMPDAVEMRVGAVVDLADDAPIGMSFVGADRDRSVKPHPFDCLAQQCPERGAVRIDRTPQILPPATNTDMVSSTCQSTLARRRCFSARFVSSGPNFWTQHYTVDRSTMTQRSPKRSTTSL